MKVCKTDLIDLLITPLPDGWRRLTMTGDTGTHCVIEADHPSATLSLPLGVNGHCRLHIELVVRPGQRNTAMQVRITPTGHWRRVRPMRLIRHDTYAIQDVDLGGFDLSSDSNLQIRTEPGCTAAVACVRTEPAAAVDPPRHRNNVGMVFDTNMTMSMYNIQAPDDLLTVLRPYEDSDVSHLFWGTTVGTYSPLYFSKSLDFHGREKTSFFAQHREATARVMRMFAKHKVDPLQLAIDHAHAGGLELWAHYRISKNHKHDFTDDYAGGRFLIEHRDKRVLNREGSPHVQTTMSFAYPQIRAMAVRMLVEQASYNIDGIFIDFARKYPLVGWEPIVVDAFKKKTGKDPDHLPSGQWQCDWISHICSYVTQFLRELREALRPIELHRGRRIPIAVQVPGGWRFKHGIASALLDAMDPITWAKEGLIDILAPCEWSALMLETQCFDRFGPTVEDTGCKLWGAIGPQFREGHVTSVERAKFNWSFADTDPWRYMATANDYYGQGADGVFIWEAQDITSVMQVWNVVRHIGDRESLRHTFGGKLGRFDGSHWVKQIPLIKQDAPP